MAIFNIIYIYISDKKKEKKKIKLPNFMNLKCLYFIKVVIKEKSSATLVDTFFF